MMLHRMKYLLKIPLLAISVACNRSAQEIKMIVLQSPIPLMLPTHNPPFSHSWKQPPAQPRLSRRNPPPPPAPCYHHCKHLQPLPLMSSLHDNSSFGRQRMGPYVCVEGLKRWWSWASNLNYRHSALSWGEDSTRQLHCQGCRLQESLLIGSGGRWSQTAGTSKERRRFFFVPNSCQVVQGRSEVRESPIIGCLSCKSTHFQRLKGQVITSNAEVHHPRAFTRTTSRKTFWRCAYLHGGYSFCYYTSLNSWYFEVSVTQSEPPQRR